jgi:predicted transposase YbfD/YdcC
MESGAVDCGALNESIVFLEHFSELKDPRQQGKVLYPLAEVLLLCLLAVLAGAETFVDIALFGEKKLHLLRRLLPYVNGTPPHDRLGEIFAALDAEAFQRCFVSWVSAITKIPAEVIAIDGKTSRRSYTKKGANDAIHIVSAFAARQRLVLAQTKVEEKSNEIVAIPKLLAMLSLEGAIVTIDAIGCQKEIAKQIVDKGADYVLALKGNQGTLRADVELFAAEQNANGFKDTTVSRHETVDGDHGRVETRKYTVLHDISWLKERHNWPGLSSIVMVESTRETGTKIETETRFYIASLQNTADQIATAVRTHWAIENSLHWVMDMVFRDDDCRVREGNAAANFVTLKHMAHNLARRGPGNMSIRARRKAAAWDDEYLLSLAAA